MAEGPQRLKKLMPSGIPSLTDICVDHIVKRRIRLTPHHVQQLSEDTVNKLIQRFIEEHGLTDRTVYFFLTRHRTKLDFTQATSLKKRILLEIPRLCHDLREISLAWCKQVGNHVVRTLLHGCRFLQVLRLTGCQRISDAAFTSRPFDPPYALMELIHIGLSSCPQITDLTVSIVVKKCPNLRILEIARNNQITNTSIVDVLRSCPFLQCLNVAYCSKLSLQGLCRSTSLCLAPLDVENDTKDGQDHTNVQPLVNSREGFIKHDHDACLEEVHFGALSVDSYVTLENLVDIRNLRVLDLRWCHGVNDRFLKPLYQQAFSTPYACLRLRKICLRGCSDISPKLLNCLAKCSNLTHVDLSWCLKLNPYDIFNLLKNHQWIEYLNISFCCPMQNICSASSPGLTRRFLPISKRYSEGSRESSTRTQSLDVDLSASSYHGSMADRILAQAKLHLGSNSDLDLTHQEFEDSNFTSVDPDVFPTDMTLQLGKLNLFMFEWWKFYLKDTKSSVNKFLSTRTKNQKRHMYSVPQMENTPSTFDLSEMNSMRRHLTRCFIPFLTHSCHTLTQFKCDGLPSVIFPEALNQLASCTSLESLSIKLPHCRFTDGSTNYKKLSLLNSLELQPQAQELLVSDFEHLGKNIPLKKLRIDFSLCTFWHQNFFILHCLPFFHSISKMVLKLTSHFPPCPPSQQRSLEDDLSLDTLFHSIFATPTGEYRMELRTLQLFNCQTIQKSLTHAAQHRISNQSNLLHHSLHKLRSFLISDCLDMVDDDVFQLAQAFPQAKKVFFINCPQLTEKAYFTILNCCKEIERLHVVGKNFQKRFVR